MMRKAAKAASIAILSLFWSPTLDAAAQTSSLQIASATEDAPITLKREILLEESVLRLGDLFGPGIEKADMVIAQAPAPGEGFRLEARWLGRIARAYGVDWQPRTTLDTAVVRRAAKIIDRALIEDMITKALYERLPQGDFALEIEQDNRSLVTDPKAEPHLAAVTLDSKAERFSATIELHHPAGILDSFIVTGSITEMVTAPMLTRSLARGEIVSRKDVEMVELPVHRLSTKALLDVQDILGMAAQRSLRAGRALQQSDLHAPLLVDKNQRVTMIYEASGLHLTTLGRAMEDGSKGEIIRIMNLASNAIVAGEILPDGRVLAISAHQISAHQ